MNINDKQYLNALEVKIKAEKILNFINIIKNSLNKHGMILTHTLCQLKKQIRNLMQLVNLKIIIF